MNLPAGAVRGLTLGRPSPRESLQRAEWRVLRTGPRGPRKYTGEYLDHGSVRRLGFTNRPARSRAELPANSGDPRKKKEEQVDDGSHPPHSTRTGRPGRSGADHPAEVHECGGPPLRLGRMGAPRRADRPRRQGRVRAGGRRVPAHVVAERDEHRRPEVLPRSARLAGPRALGEADDLPRRGDDRRLGPGARLLRHAGRRRQLRGGAHVRAAAPDGGVQLAGLVQRRLRGARRSARPASS